MEYSTMPFPRLLKTITLWNQKLHVYIGLYLLVFAWLFAFSGLILNHSRWQFPQFWDSRQETTVEATVRMPSASDDVAKARDMMGQLGLSGEIDDISAKPDGFEFRVSKPQQIVTVAINPASGKAVVTQIRWNAWGVVNALHHLTGVHGDNAALTRNHPATWLWSVFVDAVSVGLLLLVMGGIYLWFQRKESRVGGLVALLLGLLCCGLFVFGL
jgi:hypothetical protein